ALQLPSLPWMVLSPLDDKSTLKASFPIPRKDRLDQILALAELISDRIIQLLDLAEQQQDFQLPEFRLPEPPVDVPLAFQAPPISSSTDVDSVDHEFQWNGVDSPLSPHMLEVLSQAGKTKDDLTEQLFDVLKHSERLQRQSARLGGMTVQRPMFPTP